DLEAIVVRCLAPDPGARFDDGAALVRALDARSLPWRRWRALAAAMACAAAVGALGAAARQRSHRPPGPVTIVASTPLRIDRPFSRAVLTPDRRHVVHADARSLASFDLATGSSRGAALSFPF